MKSKILLAVALSCATAAPLLAAEAVGSFPTRPIRLVVPTGAGGSMDAMARAVAQEAGKALGQTIVVDNRPGAGNTMSAIIMVGAAPDGYTLGVIPCAVLKMPYVTKSQYDPMKDLTFISRISDFALVTAVRADSPYKSMAELTAASKKKGLFYATAGKYNAPHLATIRLVGTTGADWTDVAFKSDAEAITALLAGEVQFVVSSNSVFPFIQSGKLRALGVYGDKRAKGVFAETPTVSEQGYPVIENCPFGVMGPKNMDPALVSKLDGAFQQAVNSPLVKDTASKFGLDADYADAKDFDSWARKSYAQDRSLFQKLGIKPE
jgi:tripartite-type tricarboxylate transporter receptor subunit TctC